MAKLAVLTASLLIALFAFAEATTYTTTITTTIDNNQGSSQQGSRQECQQEIQKQPLHQCARYLSQAGQQHQTRPAGQQQEQQQLQQCCEQLRNVDQRCRCEAIAETVRQQTQSGEMQGQQMQEVLRRAQELPRDCQFQEPQQCQIQPTWFYSI